MRDALALAGTHLWQVTLLSAVVLLACRWVGRLRPQFGYLLCLLVVLKCLVPPVWGSMAGAFCWMQPTTPAVQSPEELHRIDVVSSETSVDRETTASSSIASEGNEFFDWTTALLVVWLVGAIVLTTIVAVRWTRLHGLLSESREPEDEALTARLDALTIRLGLCRARLRIVDAETTPFVAGVLRPVIVLPRSLAESLPVDAIEPILAHELAHVRRWDVLAGRLQLAAQVLWWFHPLVWWVQWQARRMRERCCDEVVVGELGIPTRLYAQSLVEVAALGSSVRTPVGVPGMAAFDVTAGRIRHLIDRRGRANGETTGWEVAIALLLAVTLLPGAALSSGSTSREPAIVETPDAAETESASDAIVQRTEPKQHEFVLRPIDGYVRDANDDGRFETVDAGGDTVRLTADEQFALKEEVGLFEFDTLPIPAGHAIESVRFEGRTTLAQHDSLVTSVKFRVELYAGDGRIELDDATRPGEPLNAVELADDTLVGFVTIELDPELIRELFQRQQHIGLRLVLERGDRVFFASQDHYSPDDRPRLVVVTRG